MRQGDRAWMRRKRGAKRGVAARGAAKTPRMSINVAFWAGGEGCVAAPPECRHRAGPDEQWGWEESLPPWETWEAGFPGEVPPPPKGRSKARMLERKKAQRQVKAGRALGRPELGGAHGTLAELVATEGGVVELSMPAVSPVWVD